MQWSTKDVGVPTVFYGTESGKLLQVSCPLQQALTRCPSLPHPAGFVASSMSEQGDLPVE